MRLSARPQQAYTVNITCNVKPHDLAGGPGATAVAVFFWSCAALIVVVPLGLYVLLAVGSVAWAQMPPSPVPWVKVSLVQVGAVVVLVAPLYFAPGVRRLARSARFALLGPLACLVALVVIVALPGPLA
jgi:hypothetical protein